MTAAGRHRRTPTREQVRADTLGSLTGPYYAARHRNT